MAVESIDFARGFAMDKMNQAFSCGTRVSNSLISEEHLSQTKSCKQHRFLSITEGKLY